MHMTPRLLSDWNLDVVKEIVAKGIFEDEDFDFKLGLPDNRNDKSKQKMRETCAAFANTNGGFLVFGVKDDRLLNVEARVVGMDKAFDFPRHFGEYPRLCSPSVEWAFIKSPIELPTGKVLNIVHIPKSWKAPHAVGSADQGWRFQKRTNKGNEGMNMDEVRYSFLSFYEKRIQLQLLHSELTELRDIAGSAAIHELEKKETNYSFVTFDLLVIQSVLADTYSLTSTNPNLLDALSNLRYQARIANTKIELFFRKLALPLSNMTEIVRSHNEFMIEKSKVIQEWCDKALVELDEILNPPLA
jgi:Putative DNA-binding domain